jgi:hypothetical protein
MVSRVLQRELPRATRGRSNPRLAVEMLFGMVRSICLYRGPRDTLDSLSRLITDTFLNGVASTAGPRLAAERRQPSLRVVTRNRRES